MKHPRPAVLRSDTHGSGQNRFAGSRGLDGGSRSFFVACWERISLFQRLLAEQPLRPPALGSAKSDPTPAPTCWSLLAHHIRSFGAITKRKARW